MIASVIGNTSREIQLLTYGSPHPGDQRLRFLAEGVYQANLVNDGDPVPVIPPTGKLLAGLQALVPGGFLLGWNNWRPPVLRIGLDVEGNFRDNPDPTDLYSLAFSIVQRWFLSQPIDQFNAHMAGDGARISIEAAPRGQSDDEPNGFTLEYLLLPESGACCHAEAGHRYEVQYCSPCDPFHASSFRVHGLNSRF
jgi:hypothetical protein